ncbi:hypothetical protein N0V84_006537 [Fusarium piperis]|uniref:Uncharacterized protein n=1 Tax=Fusarium piperis TaxID=1435070 RepID=A0A9W8WBN5_9HYPO|nr:hypothetical protein N0V84_006537 [Fusarium piperis]
MRERDRYNPDADGLYDFELWEDAPSDLPGRMYPLDETEMDELGATCRELMGKAISVGETVSDIPDHIAQAHKDTLEVISEIAYRLRVLYANNNTDQDSIMGSYLSEFEASHIAYWDEQVPVEDPNLTKSRHKRKNPRSLIMRNVSRWEERTHLHSLGALGAKLSGLIDSIADLRSQAQVLESRMIELAKDPQNDKACLLPFTQDLLDMDKVLNDISILAEHQTSVVREMLDSIDALRVSLRGFHRGRIERGLFGNRFGHLCLLRNDTALQGDHWQATWAWMGFDMDAWTRRTPSSSAIKVVRYIKKCLPRHPVRLPDVMVQYEALRDAFRIAEQETKRLGTWVPNVPAKLREIRDGLGSFA